MRILANENLPGDAVTALRQRRSKVEQIGLDISPLWKIVVSA